MAIPVGNFSNLQISLSEYRARKIRMLETEFMLAMKPDEKAHMNGLQSVAEIDRYARTLLLNRWN